MSRPRFIAGAVCPNCSEMDRLQVVEEQGGQQRAKTGAKTGAKKRRCVACGYEDNLASTASQMPANRLDGGLKKPDPTTIRPVRFLDPGGNKS